MIPRRTDGTVPLQSERGHDREKRRFADLEGLLREEEDGLVEDVA